MRYTKILDDHAFKDGGMDFLAALLDVSSYRLERMGKKVRLLSEEQSSIGEHDKFASLRYSGKEVNYTHLMVAHTALRKFSMPYFKPCGIQDPLSDYVYFEWLMGFNPVAEKIKRDHFAHISKVAWCCLCLIEAFKEIPFKKEPNLFDHMTSLIKEKFETFCQENGVKPLSNPNYENMFLEIILLAAYVHDKGIIFNYFDDLRAKVLTAFRPMWKHSFLVYGGIEGEGRKKYSVMCQGKCAHLHEDHKKCKRRKESIEGDREGMQKLHEFLEGERVFGAEYWLNLFGTDIAPQLPRTIYCCTSDDDKNNNICLYCKRDHGKKKIYHGFYAAWELLSLEIGFLPGMKELYDDCLEREFIFALAAQAVALHDLKSKQKIDIDEMPIAFLLYLADELQQWEREKLDLDALLERRLDWVPGEISQVNLTVTKKNELIIGVPLAKIYDKKRDDYGPQKAKILRNIRKANTRINNRLNTRGYFSIINRVENN